jgi:single-stranded-DNA-specific exonuclease
MARGYDESEARAFVHRYGLPDIIARMLAGRNVDIETVESFLNPTLKALFPDPSSLQDMDKAAEAVLKALVDNQPSAVLADYDVDGGTSAALLIRYFRAWGRELELYVPDRLTEGYGPSPAAFSELAGRGIKLVMTVDCGAAAIEALTAAQDLGLGVVVLDHHLMRDTPPPAVAVVNPNRPDDASGCGYLAGVGVTFVLCVAVNRLARERGLLTAANEPNLMQWLDLCALGTICDLAPLVGLNRALVVQGLKVLGLRSNPGVAALSEIAGVEVPNKVYHAGFVFGPRLNAGGRIGESWLATRVLASDDLAEIRQIASRLDMLNEERKAIENAITEEALQKAAEKLTAEPELPVIVLDGEGWHPGVIGIVAGRIKDRLLRPVFVFGHGPEFGDLAKGSGRSIAGVNLGRAVSDMAAQGLIKAGGGHAMAAGASVDIESLESFEAGLIERLKDQASEDVLAAARALEIDAVVDALSATVGLVELVERAGPYGAGQPEPVFAMGDVTPLFVKELGNGHIRFTAEDRSGGRLDAIAFRAADRAGGKALLAGKKVHLAGRLSINAWKGRRKAQMEVMDIAPVEDDAAYFEQEID